MGEGGSLEVGEDLLDDRVAAMGPVRGDGVHDIGGDGGVERMEPPDGKQRCLVGVGGRLEVGDAAYDQAAGDLLRCLGGCEGGERDLGDLGP